MYVLPSSGRSKCRRAVGQVYQQFSFASALIHHVTCSISSHSERGREAQKHGPSHANGVGGRGLELA